VGDVRFNLQAQDDLGHVWFQVSKENPRAAHQIVDSKLSKCDLVSDFPEMGPTPPELGEGVRIFFCRPFVIAYRPFIGGIEVLAIVHGARDPRSWLP
jgi:toxin ParE1/3/4